MGPLSRDHAAELIEPASVAGRESGTRSQVTIEVNDVDAVREELAERGCNC